MINSWSVYRTFSLSSASPPCLSLCGETRSFTDGYRVLDTCFSPWTVSTNVIIELIQLVIGTSFHYFFQAPSLHDHRNRSEGLKVNSTKLGWHYSDFAETTLTLYLLICIIKHFKSIRRKFWEASYLKNTVFEVIKFFEMAFDTVFSLSFLCLKAQHLSSVIMCLLWV